MEPRYKIKTIAGDLCTTPAELITSVKESLGTEKKLTSTLSVEEVNFLLDKFSLSHEVTSFEPYFAARELRSAPKPPKPVRAPRPKADKGTAAAVTASDKAATATAEQPKKAKPDKANKKSETAVAATANPGTETAAAKPGTETTAKPSAKPSAPPRPNVKKLKNGILTDFNALDYKIDRSSRPQAQTSRQSQHTLPSALSKFESRMNKQFAVPEPSQGGNRSAQAKNQRTAEEIRAEKEQRNKLKQAHKLLPKQIEAVVDVSKLKVNEPPKQRQKSDVKSEVRHEQVVKHVDTRSSTVELDKYNERYETIAPQSLGGGRKPDTFGRKQKINQKSQQRNNKFRPRETEWQKLKRLELERARKQQLKVMIPDEIVVSDLAQRLKVTASDVIKKLFHLGVITTINEVVDFDTAALAAEELGAKVEHEKIFTIEERLFEEVEDTDTNLRPRSPVVVVMGHVDHGKTSLLDCIRSAAVAEGEAGGITQHIGAYQVTSGEKHITFLDTPGHEAFTEMRARGAKATDIAILVVAADDGIMPQTVEAINHAKAAEVAIIVAINKIDKEGANPSKVKQELTEHGLVCEEWGGDVICCEVSAKKNIGVDNLLEMVNLTAEVLELKANPDRLAVGTVIEARLDKGRGVVASLLVQKGTLKNGDAIIAGTAVGRVRTMDDHNGKPIDAAEPSVPVVITGLSEVPAAGDAFAVVADEKLARELAEKRKYEAKEQQFALYEKVTLDNLFSSIEHGNQAELRVIIKGDVGGSVEALVASLLKLSNEEVRLRVIHSAVGAVSESDVMLASASSAIIVGFNVIALSAAADKAKEDKVDVRLYRVIYNAIEEIEAAMKGMLAPKFREVDTGKAEVRNVFKITNVGVVAGCYITSGKIARNNEVRVVRDGIIVATCKIAGLQRFKDSVKDVAEGYECGISLEKFSDVKEGDVFEAFLTEEYRD